MQKAFDFMLKVKKDKKYFIEYISNAFDKNAYCVRNNRMGILILEFS